MGILNVDKANMGKGGDGESRCNMPLWRDLPCGPPTEG